MLYVDCRHCCYCTMWTSSTAKYFKLWFPKGLLPFFCIPVFSWIVESLCLVSMWKLWLFGCNSSMNSWPDLYGQYTGSTGFCQFWADGTAGHLLVLKISLIFFFFSSAALCFTVSTILSIAHFCVVFQTSMKTTSWNTSTEIFVWERPCWCLCLVAVLSLAFIYIFWKRCYSLHHFFHM